MHSVCDGESLALNSARPNWPDGVYWIDPMVRDLRRPLRSIMTTIGGGWTHVIVAHTDDVSSDPASVPPDFTYFSDIWTTGYGDHGTEHICLPPGLTPFVYRGLWIEDDTRIWRPSVLMEICLTIVVPAVPLGSMLTSFCGIDRVAVSVQAMA